MYHTCNPIITISNNLRFWYETKSQFSKSNYTMRFKKCMSFWQLLLWHENWYNHLCSYKLNNWSSNKCDYLLGSIKKKSFYWDFCFCYTKKKGCIAVQKAAGGTRLKAQIDSMLHASKYDCTSFSSQQSIFKDV